MKIAVTGGNGLLGSYFVQCIKNDGVHTPIILSRSKSIQNTYIRTTDYSVSSLIEALDGIDAVVHLAAYRGNSTYLKDYHVNTNITQNLYEACKLKNITNIVYASSISVYSQEKLLPWKEDQVPSPVSIYGISKLNCEYLSDYFNREYGFYIKNLRFAHIFGANEKNNYMINKFMRQAIKKEELVLFSKDNAKREFLYAKDASLAILRAIEAKRIRGTFNIGSGEALTNIDVAVNINIAFHNNRLTIQNGEEKLLKSSYMISDKAFMGFNYKPHFSFIEALKDIYKEIKDV